MKIVTDREVYVQKNDIIELNHVRLEMPASIFLKIFGDDIVVIDDSNRFEFVKFEEEHEIEFLKNLDWIIDYNVVKDLSNEEIFEMKKRTLDKRNEIVKKFDSMSDVEMISNIEKVEEILDVLDFTANSLTYILMFKQGHLKFELPEGIEYPEGYFKEEKGIKKLVKSIFDKKNKK